MTSLTMAQMSPKHACGCTRQNRKKYCPTHAPASPVRSRARDFAALTPEQREAILAESRAKASSRTTRVKTQRKAKAAKTSQAALVATITAAVLAAMKAQV